MEKWKISYAIREKRANSEAGEVLGETLNAWMERLWELREDYDPDDIWKMHERGCFFKAILEKVLTEKKSQVRGGKKSKTRLTTAFSSVLQERKLLHQLLFKEMLNRDVSRT